MDFKPPSAEEVHRFIEEDLGISLVETGYELIPIEKDGNFEFYMIAFFTYRHDRGVREVDVSLAAYWPKTEEEVVLEEPISPH